MLGEGFNCFYINRRKGIGMGLKNILRMDRENVKYTQCKTTNQRWGMELRGFWKAIWKES